MEMWIQKLVNNAILKLLLLTGAVYLFLQYLSPLISPILLAMLFVTIFGPLLKKIKEKLHICRQISAVLLLITAVGVLAGIVIWIGSLLWKSLPELLQQVESTEASLPSWVMEGYRQIRNILAAGDLEFQKGFLDLGMKYAGKMALLGGYVITFIIAVILLAKDYDELMNKLLSRDDCRLLLEVICGVIRYIATYVKAQAVIMSVIGVMCAAGLLIAGVKNAVLWGLLAGLLDALPFIGTGVVLMPLSVFQILDGRYFGGGCCLVLYIVCIFARQILEPKLIGKKMGIRPIVVLISLYTGIRLFGLAGILKGPLGFVILWQMWQPVFNDSAKNEKNSLK